MKAPIGGAAAFAVAWLGLATASFAGVAEGRAALQAGDFPTALRELGAAARVGDPQAQNLYATLLKDGAGGAPDATAAVAWYRRAAEAGDAEAQVNLGYMLFHGQGVPRDRQGGLGWYERAAAQGNPAAQFNAARVYWDGDGVPRDPAKALKLFQAAAEAGVAEAQFSYGVALLAPPKPDAARAFNWFSRAARQGEAPAYAKLAAIYLLGQGVPKDPVTAQTWALLGEAAGDPLAAQLRTKLDSDLTPEQSTAARQQAAAFVPVRERP